MDQTNNSYSDEVMSPDHARYRALKRPTSRIVNNFAKKWQNSFLVSNLFIIFAL